MGETTDQIERDIRTTRVSLSENLGELQDRLKTAVDWRAQVTERPGTMLALAFGGGILLSAILPTRGRRRHETPARRERPEVSKVTVPSSPGKAELPKNGTTDTLNALKAALVGVAVTRASTFIGELLPGFKEQLLKAQASK
jgi:hypothetical protein